MCVHEFCPICGARRVLDLHPDGSVSLVDLSCPCCSVRTGVFTCPQGEYIMVNQNGDVIEFLSEDPLPRWAVNAGKVLGVVVLLLIAAFFAFL